MRGHVQKVNGRWHAVLELDASRDPETGERKRNRRGVGAYATKREAEDALQEAMDQSKRGWRGPSRLTLARYLREDWLPGVAMDHAATTTALYHTIIETYVVPSIGGITLDALTSADLTNLYRRLLAGGGRGGRALAPKTVRHVHTTLRKALGDAVDDKSMTWNPATAAKAPKVPSTKDPKAWTAEQLHTFLASVEGDRLGPLWTLAASTGMRRGELVGLCWGDVDLAVGTLTVRQTRVSYGSLTVTKAPKTEFSRRTIPLAESIVAVLRGHRRRQAEEKLAAGAAYADQDYVFATEIGDPLEPSTVSRAFARAVRASGLPKISLHGLRHTFATVGLEAGVDVLYVAGMLGHSSPAITMSIYQHVRRERLEQAANTIWDAIFN